MSIWRHHRTSFACRPARKRSRALSGVALALALGATGAGQATAADYECPPSAGGKCTVTGAVTWEKLGQAGFSGLLSDLAFSGPGGKVTFADDTTLQATSGSADQRLVVGDGVTATLSVADGKTLTIKGGTLETSNANAWGGAIQSIKSTQAPTQTALTIDGTSIFTGNMAKSEKGFASGGAIYSGGWGPVLTFLRDATFTENSAVSGSGRSWGGAIFNSGPLRAYGATKFSENSVTSQSNEAYGGAMANGGFVTFFKDVTFSGNRAFSISGAAVGGAVYNSTSTVTLSGGAVFSGNRAQSDTGNAMGGAIASIGIVNLSKAVTFSGNIAESRSGEARGGAIYNTVNVNLSGEATFTGNSATSASSNAYGGAIFSGGGSKITLEPGEGKTILFSGNTANGVANSIYLQAIDWRDAWVRVVEAGTVDMRSDPMAGQTLDGGSITLFKDGTSTWWLGGENVFAADDNADSRTDFRVKNGTLAFAAGASGGTTVDLRGLKSAFAPEAPATLRLEGDSHKILAGNGGLSPATGTGGTITLAAGSTLTFDLDAARQKTTVLTLRAENVVLPTASGETVNLDVRSFKNVVGAEYWLLDAGVDLTDRVTLKYRGETIVGSSLEGALVGELSADKKVQKLIVKQLPNRKLTWVGDSNTWNTTIADKWRLPDGTTLTVFLPGDAVEFIPEHTGTVDINAGGVVVAGMEIKGGTFVFKGGEI
ncbi:hypothetical protein IHV25_09745, partial [Phaeovibrio sulfidiphilus]